MIRLFYTLRTGIRQSLIAIATTALILPSLSPAFAGDRSSPVYPRGCNHDFGGCLNPAPHKKHYHRHGNQKPHYHKHNSQNPHAHRRGQSKPHYVQRKSKNDTAKWLAAGIIGLAAGAIIIGEAQKHKAKKHAVQPQPKRLKPTRIYAGHDENFQPWTRGWYRWCAQRYRSFNPRTGTYRGYDGYDHFCVVK